MTALSISAQERQIKITINGETEVTATLLDNATARDFISRIPFTVSLTDYAGTEKIFYPSPALSTEGAPSGYDPSIGDITLYAPWGDVAIFYKDFGYANGLVPIGSIDGNGIQAFNTSGSLTATFELIDAATNIDSGSLPENGIKIYPNPTHGIFEIFGQFESVTLMEANGNGIQFTNTNKIDISNYPPGTYILKIELKNKQTILKKIIKA